MMRGGPTNRLDRPVDRAYDHTLGPADAPITLVEYGSYDCPHCRAANEPIAALRDEFGDRLRYVFDIARSRAAKLPGALPSLWSALPIPSASGWRIRSS